MFRILVIIWLVQVILAAMLISRPKDIFDGTEHPSGSEVRRENDKFSAIEAERKMEDEY